MIAWSGWLKIAIGGWRFIMKAPRRRFRTRWILAAHPELRLVITRQTQIV
jgi:hypothetical protein